MRTQDYYILALEVKFYSALQLLRWFLTHYVIFILYTCVDYCTGYWVLKPDRVFYLAIQLHKCDWVFT